MLDAVTGLDHIVVNVLEEMDEAAAFYQRLGFTLTPRGYHSMGSINHLVVFQQNYLELLGVPPGVDPTTISPILGGPVGFSACALATEDAAAVYQACSDGDTVRALPPRDFSRPVALPEGPQDAAFRVTNFSHDGPPPIFFVCQHFTRELVWRNEWQQHANTAEALNRMVIRSPDPAAAVASATALFGADQVVAEAEATVVHLGDVTLEYLSDRRFDEAVHPEAKSLISLQAGSVAAAVRILSDNHIDVTMSDQSVLRTFDPCDLGIIYEFFEVAIS